MKRSDFFKHLYLAAVSSGQIHTKLTSEEATTVMTLLMDRYLDAVQGQGRPKGGRLRKDRDTRERGHPTSPDDAEADAP